MIRPSSPNNINNMVEAGSSSSDEPSDMMMMDNTESLFTNIVPDNNNNNGTLMDSHVLEMNASPIQQAPLGIDDVPPPPVTTLSETTVIEPQGLVDSPSPLPSEEVRQYKRELSSLLLSIIARGEIQTSVKRRALEKANETATSNVLSYQFKKRQPQHEDTSYNRNVSTTTNHHHDGTLATMVQSSASHSLTSSLLSFIDTNAAASTPLLGSCTPSSTTTTTMEAGTDQSSSTTAVATDGTAANGHHDAEAATTGNHTEGPSAPTTTMEASSRLDETNPMDESMINTNIHEDSTMMYLPEEITDDEEEEELFLKNYLKEYRNDDLIVAIDEQQEDPSVDSNKVLVMDHFRKTLLCEWNEFKRPIQFQYEFIQTRIEQLRKEFTTVNDCMREKELVQNIDTNETCSKLNGLPSKNWSQHRSVFRSTKLYNALYPPFKRRTDFLQHPFFGSFDVFHREATHYKEIQDNPTDLTRLSSSWLSGSHSVPTPPVVKASFDGNNKSNTAITNPTHPPTSPEFPLPFISSKDILDSFELYNNLYPLRQRSLPLSFSQIQQKRKQFKKKGIPTTRKGIRIGGTRTPRSTQRRDDDYNPIEDIVIFDSNSTTVIKDVRPKEILTPSFRIMTQKEVLEEVDPNEDDVEEDISDAKYCYSHIEKELQERQKYYLSSIPNDKKKKKFDEEEERKNMKYEIPPYEKFVSSFDNYTKLTEDDTDMVHRLQNTMSDAVVKSANGTGSTTLNNEGEVQQLTYLVPVDQINSNQLNQLQPIMTPPVNAKLAYMQNPTNMTSPNKKSIKKADQQITPRWKLITLESYIPYPVMVSDDKRGNWEILAKTERRAVAPVFSFDDASSSTLAPDQRKRSKDDLLDENESYSAPIVRKKRKQDHDDDDDFIVADDDVYDEKETAYMEESEDDEDYIEGEDSLYQKKKISTTPAVTSGKRRGRPRRNPLPPVQESTYDVGRVNDTKIILKIHAAGETHSTSTPAGKDLTLLLKNHK